MLPWRFTINAGMVAAGVLLAVGAGLMLLADDDQRRLQQIGMGIVALSGVVYLVARIRMLVKGRRS